MKARCNPGHECLNPHLGHSKRCPYLKFGESCYNPSPKVAKYIADSQRIFGQYEVVSKKRLVEDSNNKLEAILFGNSLKNDFDLKAVSEKFPNSVIAYNKIGNEHGWYNLSNLFDEELYSKLIDPKNIELQARMAYKMLMIVEAGPNLLYKLFKYSNPDIIKDVINNDPLDGRKVIHIKSGAGCLFNCDACFLKRMSHNHTGGSIMQMKIKYSDAFYKSLDRAYKTISEYSKLDPIISISDETDVVGMYDLMNKIGYDLHNDLGPIIERYNVNILTKGTSQNFFSNLTQNQRHNIELGVSISAESQYYEKYAPSVDNRLNFIDSVDVGKKFVRINIYNYKPKEYLALLDKYKKIIAEMDYIGVNVMRYSHFDKKIMETLGHQFDLTYTYRIVPNTAKPGKSFVLFTMVYPLVVDIYSQLLTKIQEINPDIKVYFGRENV